MVNGATTVAAVSLGVGSAVVIFIIFCLLVVGLLAFRSGAGGPVERARRRARSSVVAQSFVGSLTILVALGVLAVLVSA